MAFRDFFLDLERAQLLRQGEPRPLRPKSFDVLCHLVQHAGQLVTREQLLDNVWAGSVVTDASVTACLIDIRRALDDHDKVIIRTIPRRGYILEPPAHGIRAAASQQCIDRDSQVPGGSFRWLLGSALVGLVALTGWASLERFRQSDVMPEQQSLASATSLAASEANAEALRIFRQAHHSFEYQWDDNRLPELRDMLLQVLQLQPDHVAALNLLGRVYAQLTSLGALDWDEGWQLVATTAHRAMALAPGNGVPLTLLALVKEVRDRDYPAAEQLYTDALALSPQDPDVQVAVASFYRLTGNPRAAIEMMQATLPFNPLCAKCHYLLYFAYLQQHDFEQAEHHIRRYQSLGRGGVLSLAELLVITGRPEQAATVMEGWWEPPWEGLYMRALIAYELGQTHDFDRTLRQLQRDGSAESVLRVAQLHAWSGDNDAAFSALMRARDSRNSSLAARLRSCLFDSLHDDPRWPRMLSSMGLLGQELAVVEK